MRPSRSSRRADAAAPAGRALLRALSWALAGLGALCLALTALAFALGARPLVVRTGSMAPSLGVGTVAIVKPAPASEARPGDVVAVRRPDGTRVLHRVELARAAGGESVTLVLRGDANRRADPAVTVRAIERPLLVVPWLGKPVGWLDGPWLQYWLGVLTGALALAWLVRRRGDAGGRLAEPPPQEAP